MERNQVLYSPLSESYYFVARARRVADGTTLLVIGDKVDVSASVKPLVASAVAGHLRALADSAVFDKQGRAKILAAARQVERHAGINATNHEG